MSTLSGTCVLCVLVRRLMGSASKNSLPRVSQRRSPQRVSRRPSRPLAVYMVSSLSAGIAGIIETGWLGAVTTNLGAGMELQVIAATVIGGANLAGGVGTAFGALVGSALIEVIRNSLGLLGISAFWRALSLALSSSSRYRSNTSGICVRLNSAARNNIEPQNRLVRSGSAGGGTVKLRCRDSARWVWAEMRWRRTLKVL